jgi:hypothetical protein
MNAAHSNMDYARKLTASVAAVLAEHGRTVLDLLAAAVHGFRARRR